MIQSKGMWNGLGWQVVLFVVTIATCALSAAVVGQDACADTCACDATHEHLNCTARVSHQSAITTLPGNATSVLFESNNISAIPAYLLKGVPLLQFLSVRYNKIRRIDNDTQLCLNNKLQHLYADGNRIRYIAPEAFKGCSNLSTLSLRTNLLTIDLIAPVLPFLPQLHVLDCGVNQFGTPTILPAEFLGLPELRALFLDYMEIQHIPSDFLSNLNASQFQQLSIAGNLLLHVSPTAFNNLTNINIFDFSKTHLSFNETFSIFSAIKNSQNLHRIDMQENFIFNVKVDLKFEDSSLFESLENNTIKILHIEHNFGGFKGFLRRSFLSPLVDLEELYLDYNQLRVIHHNALIRNHKLQILSLKNNYLSCLTDCQYQAISPRLPHLQTLDLSGNVIDDKAGYLAFSRDIFPQLKHLNLRNNRISEIDNDLFFDIYSIRTLDLSENPIGFIRKESFVTLSGLTKLVIENSLTIEELPKMMFSGLTSLSELRLSRNNIKTVYKDTWMGLETLQYLDMSYNALGANVEIEILSSNITTVDLSYNNIETIPDQFVKSGTALKTLILSHNRISAIKISQLRNLTNLTKLDLSYNNFVTVDIELFDSFDLHWLDLAGNPFYCCQSKALIAWLRSNEHILVHARNTKCLEPSEESQKLLLNYSSGADHCKSSSTSSLQVVVMLTSLVLTSVALLTISAVNCAQRCRKTKLCSKHKSSDKIPANDLSISVTCSNKDEADINPGTSSLNTNCDNSESATSFLMKCIPLDMFKKEEERTVSENEHMGAPLMENLYESEANI